jgi:hypothetical protein
MIWTNYVDIVCANLTYNQALKDSSSSKITRDIIARIYLTESVPPLNYPTTVAEEATYFGPLPYGTRPFTIYRQFQTPKEIRWNKQQPIGQCTFEVFDDQGRSLADTWGTNIVDIGTAADWNMSLLVTEN